MSELMVLRVIHVVGGAFWVGAVVFNSAFLLPALAASGPAAGQVMANLRRRHMLTVLPVVAILTLLSGLRLIQIASGGITTSYFETGSGRTYATGGALAILGFLIGMSVVRPALNRVAALGATMATAQDDATRAAIGAEIGAVRRRGASANAIVAVLLVAATVAMAIGRYM